MFVILALAYILFTIFILILGCTNSIQLEKRAEKLLLLLFVTSIATIAYYTYPHEGSDLLRYFYELDAMKRYGVNYLLNYSLYHDTFITNFMFYGVALLGNNYFLPSISSTITLVILFSILLDQREFCKAKKSTLYRMILIIFIANTAMSIVLSVRQQLAFVCMLAAYWYDYKKGNSVKEKIVSILLYLIPLFIHYGTVPLLIVKLYKMIFKKNNPMKHMVFAVIISFSGLILEQLHTRVNNNYINLIYNKFFDYSTIEYSDVRYFYARLAFAIILIIIIAIVKKQKCESKVLYNYIDSMGMVCIMGLMFVYNQNLFSRMISFATYGYYPIFILYWKSKKTGSRFIIDCMFFVVLFGLCAYQIVSIYNQWKLIPLM